MSSSDAEAGRVVGVGDSRCVDHALGGRPPAADLSPSTGPILPAPPIAFLDKDAEKEGAKKRRFGVWESDGLDVSKRRSAEEESNQVTRTEFQVFPHQKSKRGRLRKEESMIDDSKSPVSETQVSAERCDATISSKVVNKNERKQSYATNTCSQWAKKPHRPIKNGPAGRHLSSKGTASSQAEAQRLRRNMRNRKAGAKARAREKQSMEALSRQFEVLSVEQRQLEKANAQLRIEVQDIMERLALAVAVAKQLPHLLTKSIEYPSLDTTRAVSMPACYSSHLAVDDKSHEEEQSAPSEEAAGLEPLMIEDCSTLMENMHDDWWEDPPSATDEDC